MLWNIIRDFYVNYIFGGRSSTGSQSGAIVGFFKSVNNPNAWTVDSTGFLLNQGGLQAYDDRGYIINGSITLGDWLSTTATIITLCVMVFLLFLLVRWVYKICAGLFTLRG